MTTKKTAKICIDCLFRGGSNHLTANLHYQDGFFGHSERKSFGNVARHDVFGNYRADKQFNENKYDTAKYHVWKRFWTRSGNFHYTGKNGKKHGHIVVFLIRHPYMVYKSMLRYIDKATKEDKQPANPWITDGFKNEILSDMRTGWRTRKITTRRSRRRSRFDTKRIRRIQGILHQDHI